MKKKKLKDKKKVIMSILMDCTKGNCGKKCVANVKKGLSKLSEDELRSLLMMMVIYNKPKSSSKRTGAGVIIDFDEEDYSDLPSSENPYSYSGW